MKLSEKLRFAMLEQKCGLHIHESFIAELEALENENQRLRDDLEVKAEIADMCDDLRAENSVLRQLNHDLDYCAEESDKKCKEVISQRDKVIAILKNIGHYVGADDDYGTPHASIDSYSINEAIKEILGDSK